MGDSGAGQAITASASTIHDKSSADLLKILSYGVVPTDIVAPSYVQRTNEKLMVQIQALKVPITADQLASIRQNVADQGAQIAGTDLPAQLAIYGSAVKSSDPMVVASGLYLGKHLVAYGAIRAGVNGFHAQYGAEIEASPKLAADYAAVDTALKNLREFLASSTSIRDWYPGGRLSTQHSQTNAVNAAFKTFNTDFSTIKPGSGEPLGLCYALVAINVVVLLEIAAIVIPVVFFGIIDTPTESDTWNELQLDAPQVITTP